MSLNRYAKRRDANEREIIDALEKAGAYVRQISQDGMPDLYVVYHSFAIWMEVKTEDGKVRAKQWKFITDMQERNVPAALVRTAQDALQAAGACH